MNSQEICDKGFEGKLAGKNITLESGSSSPAAGKGKKQRGKSRYSKKKRWLHKKKCAGSTKHFGNNYRTNLAGLNGNDRLKKVSQSGSEPGDDRLKEVSQSGSEGPEFGRGCPENYTDDQDLGCSNDPISDCKETGGRISVQETKILDSEDIKSNYVGLEEKPNIMEASSQSEDEKNKLLEMMSREFNSATIQEGSVSLDSKKSGRVPRLTRKRKSEVIDTSEKTHEASTSQHSPLTTPSPIIHNTITSALKKIRKESLENLPSPTATHIPGRTRRSTQERKSGSEKDPTEETPIGPEALDSAETKIDDTIMNEKSTPGTRGRKRARVRGRSFVESEEGNDSGNESPVIPLKGRGKTLSGSEEDSHIACTDSAGLPSLTKVRGRSKGLVESETNALVGRARGKGKGSAREELGSDNRGRGKQRAEGEKSEDQLNIPLASGKCRGRGKSTYEDSINLVSSNNSPAATMSTRSKGKTELEGEGPLETEVVGQQRRSMTPVRGEATPQLEPKRSQRISLSREGNLDSPLANKRGTQKPVPEIMKKQDIPSAPKLPPNRLKKEGEEPQYTKTGKKKKKHFKGLSYSFNIKKKKVKGKIGIGKHGLDTSQETDSAVSEDIDIESVDSSSQDVPSEQLSNQDQEGVEDRLSEGGENDVEMDNVDNVGSPSAMEAESLVEDSPLKVLVDASQSGKVELAGEVEKETSEEALNEEGTLEKSCELLSEMAADELAQKSTNEEVEKIDSEDIERKESNDAQGKISTNTSVELNVSVTCDEAAMKDEHSNSAEEINHNVVKAEDINPDVSSKENVSEIRIDTESTAESDVAKSKPVDGHGKSPRLKRTHPNSPPLNSTPKEVLGHSHLDGKDDSVSPALSESNCSASETAFSPALEMEVQVPEEGGGEALKTRLAEPSSIKEPQNVTKHTHFTAENSGGSLQTQLLSNKLQVTGTVSENGYKDELACQSSREAAPINEEGMRHLGRRRQSITKRKLEDLVQEGHNSDSSDSLSESRLPGEGVRKSKRLSRHGSPHPLSFAAPESPDGPGKGQSKPVSSQSANVTPASPEERHCYILSPPVNLTQSCQQQGIIQSAEPTLTNVLCKCRTRTNPLAVVEMDEVYCQAFDSLDGRMIGCCNIVSNFRCLRVSGKIPFMLLCDNHRQRLRQHNCCPCCGLFCTQGVFYECSWDKTGPRHYFHKLCSLLLNGTTLCPHCGSDHPPREVQLELKVTRKPVIYLKQHQERKELSARMTWSKGDIPNGDANPDSATDIEPTLELRNGRIISALKFPLGCGREKLQEAIKCINESKSVTVKPSNKGMYWACKLNDVEKLLHALVSGLSPNVKVKEYGSQTGLHVAAACGSVAAVHILVLAGATIDMTDNQLMTPLMIAITKEQNDVVHYLVQAGASLMAKTQDGMTCLHLAAKCGNLIACQHILESGRLTRHAVNMQDEGGWTPLVWASENKFTNVVKFLLDRGGNPQLCDVEQNTALHWAAFSGSTQICSMVLDRGCSLRSMNAHGDTPLHIAARQNHLDAVVLLLTRGAQLDVLNTKNQTPINCALSESDVYLQLTLNSKVLEIMKQNNIRTEKILSSDIAGGKEEVPIPCVNGVDEELLPKDYLYIAENCEASNVIIDRTITSLKWCECEDGCNAEHCGCGQLNFQCWYDPDGRLLPEFNYADPPMIFECNRACRCNKLSCNNRVVQHGISAHMQLFKTTGKGWGVRALKTIQKGSYVCEYVGEIITDLEADQRQDDSYLFDLDNRDSETFCIDARSYGNIARFINHLCEANLTPVKVFIDHQDLTFPRIAFFANRDIEADEELGFDYGEKFWMIKYKQFTCTCSSEKCKYSSETIQTTLENYNRKLRELQETV